MDVQTQYDAVVVGSGPNGLAAGLVLAQQGLSVLLVEGTDTVGGSMRTLELTLSGFAHDVCSAIHPLGVSSPFFREARLEQAGLEWIHPGAPAAHPLALARFGLLAMRRVGACMAWAGNMRHTAL